MNQSDSEAVVQHRGDKIFNMNSAYWIAKRLQFTHQADGSRRSRPAVRVALAGIIIGVMVMLLTVCVVVGFKQTITKKVAGFGAHIQVVNFDNNNTYEMQPITVSESLTGMGCIA